MFTAYLITVKMGGGTMSLSFYIEVEVIFLDFKIIWCSKYKKMSIELRNALSKYSDEKHNWDIMRNEWIPLERYKNDELTTCICGVRILEKCIILHKRTQLKLAVGNSCIEQFDMFPLCDHCETYTVESITSRQCKNCHKNETRPSLVIEYGHFKGNTYMESFKKNPSKLKWELENSVHKYDKHFTHFLTYRRDGNVNKFNDIVSVNPVHIRDSIVDFGKYKFKVFKDVLKEDPNYCLWVIRNDELKDKKFYQYLLSMKR